MKFKPCVGESKPLEELCHKARANLIVSAYQPQIYSALLRYSLRELGIIAEVMTVMMSLYLSHVRTPPSSFGLPLSNFTLFI